jgi:heparin binding hemagglutinin HbhA
MTPTQTVKQYSELAVAQTRTIAEQAKTLPCLRRRR